MVLVCPESQPVLGGANERFDHLGGDVGSVEAAGADLGRCTRGRVDGIETAGAAKPVELTFRATIVVPPTVLLFAAINTP